MPPIAPGVPASMSHGRFAGSVSWTDTPAGISIDGAAPIGTPGPPDTVHRVLDWFGPDITAAAHAYQVPAAMLVAIICTESAGGEHDREKVSDARRQEPGYLSDASTPWQVSVGCCQTLLSTARAALRQPRLTCMDLTHPATSILACAAYVAMQAHETRGDPVLVAAAYNAGGVYEEATPANRWRLRCYPLGTGHYIDEFAAWYNDAVRANA